jgi:CO/xanthine dehydrogenase Mo-binding subunit
VKDVQLKRRDFLGFAGGGLFVFFHAELARAQEPARLPNRQAAVADFNAYLRIAEDGRVTCFAGKVELGQGAMTSLSQVLAEDLDVPLDSVDIVMGDTDLCPYDMGTFGSMTTPLLVPAVRRAAAEARAVLLHMAAERLAVPADSLRVKAGVVADPSSPSKSVTYAGLVAGKRIERHLANVPVKPVAAFQIIGQSPRRKDALEKVTGKARFAADQLPTNLLHAAVLHLPANSAKLATLNSAAANKIDGVRIVQDGDLVAALHERPDVAMAARDALVATFSPAPLIPDDKSIFDHLLKTAPQARPAGQRGDVVEGERGATGAVEHTYLNSYVAHAPIETHSATAAFEDGKLTVWASTQAPFMVKNALTGVLGLPADKVRVIARCTGGGFGGKTEAAQAVEAARLARMSNRPVQVVWSRRDEFLFDPFRPASVMKIRAGMTTEGRIAFWDALFVGPGEREAAPFYEIPHQRTLSAGGWQGGNPPSMHPFHVGPWRAPSVNSTTFARESHMDVLAAKAGIDPVEFRLKNLTHPRMRRALETAAGKFGWKAGKAPSGRGVGVACGIYANACNATMAEVAVDKRTGAVRVNRLVLALDCGVVLNPDGLRQQAEGCLTMGLGYALTEEVRFRGGEVLIHNFDTYAIPRFSWLPKIDVVLIDNPETQALGGGEPPIICMGAVIANAIHDAIGKRLLQLPMTPDRIKTALAL